MKTKKDKTKMEKTFKLILKDKEIGKFLASQEIYFKDFPTDWKENGIAQMTLLNHQERFMNQMVEVEIIEIENK